MSSGPMTGFAEITLPRRPAGQLDHAGQGEPVMAECLSMVCFRVIGNDTTMPGRLRPAARAELS